MRVTPTTMELALPRAPNADLREKMAVLLEVARRANWDAMHGPVHLRSGRFTLLDGPPLRPEFARPDDPYAVSADGFADAVAR